MSDAVKYQVKNESIAFLSLNRPDVFNAFDNIMIEKLIEYLEHIASQTDIKVLVLQASGKAFSAGADLKWMKSMKGASFADNINDSKRLALLMSKLDDIAIPTIAKVQGAAFGGAVGLTACCDIAIASEKASFCLSEVKLGIAPAVISPFVVNAIGARQARRYMLTAERFNAQTAEKLGLVHEVVEPEQLDETVDNIIESIINNGPVAVKATKALVKRVAHGPIDQSMVDYTTELIANLRVSEEGQEGLNAFFDKRKPNWTQ